MRGEGTTAGLATFGLAPGNGLCTARIIARPDILQRPRFIDQSGKVSNSLVSPAERNSISHPHPTLGGGSVTPRADPAPWSSKMPLPSSISLEVFYSALLSLASSFNSLAELPTDKILLTTLFSTLLSKPQTLLKIPRTLLTIPYETTLLPPPQTPHTGHSAPSLTSKKLCAFHRMAGADPRVCSVAP
jgi:hypothetical protein